MSVRRTGNPVASASHTGKRGEKRKKSRFYFNKKSCMAMAVSAVLLFTSVDCMAVRAEEPTDVLLPVAEEENTEISENAEASNAAPLIISSFKVLEEEVSRIELEERESLEDVRKRMPETLIANVVPVSSMEDEMNPDEVEQPVEGEMKPSEGGTKSGVEEEQPDAGNDGNNSDTGEDDHSSDLGEIESQSAADVANDMATAAKSEISAQDGQCWRFLVETDESGADHAGSETDSADSDAGDNNGGGESEGEGESTGSAESGSEDGSTGGTEGGSSGEAEDGSEDGSSGGAKDGSEDGSSGGAEGENEDGNIEGIENGNGDAGSGTEDGSTDDMAGGNDTGTSAAGEGENHPSIEETDVSGVENPDTTAPSVDDVSLETGEVEIPVTWECENYDTEELDVYTFVPKWDETKWAFEESEEHKLPTIEVVYIESGSGVSTEEELAEALAAGVDLITL